MTRLALTVLLTCGLLAPVAAACARQPAATGTRDWGCWYAAATRYHVNPVLLFAVSHVETDNHSGVAHRNPNGSYDLGVMQINSAWLPTLRRYGITAADLLEKPCVNVNVGAWILSRTIAKHGLNWRGIGAYNATTQWKQARYARKVDAELVRLADRSNRGAG